MSASYQQSASRWNSQTTRHLLAGIAALAVLLLSGCGGGETPPASIEASTAKQPEVKPAEPHKQPFVNNDSDFVANPLRSEDAASDIPEFKPFLTPEEQGRQQSETFVTFKTSLGDIKIKLHRQQTPLTVSNFLNNYVQTGFYKDSIFHFVEKDFMLVAGGFDKNYKPLPTRPPVMNESANGFKNKRGAVGMIRDPAFDKSATSQFFVNLQDNEALDYAGPEKAGYCVFGQVVEGMEIVDRIAGVAVKDRAGFPNSPVEPITILSCQVSEK